VRVLKPGGELDLAQEAVRVTSEGRGGLEHLDGDEPCVAPVGGTVHHGHGAPADLVLQIDAMLREAGAKALRRLESGGGLAGDRATGPARRRGARHVALESISAACRTIVSWIIGCILARWDASVAGGIPETGGPWIPRSGNGG
jgi:hypothetical protein